MAYDGATPSGQSITAPNPGSGLVATIGAGVQMEGQASIDAKAAARAAAEEANNQPVIQGLAGHVKEVWSNALQAKRNTIEPRMFQSMRQRRGEYDPEILAEIRKTSGSEIYMMLTSNKCRAASSWIRDVMLGSANEKPWAINPTPLPDLPPVAARSIAAMAAQEALQYEQLTGAVVQQRDMERIVGYMKDRIITDAKKRAAEMCARMEVKMEDQLDEGGFQKAFSDFIEDIVTFPTAIMRGPIVRNKPRMKWVQKPTMAAPQLMPATPAPAAAQIPPPAPPPAAPPQPPTPAANPMGLPADAAGTQQPPAPQQPDPLALAAQAEAQVAQDNAGWTLEVADQLVLEWERVDPFMLYPAAHATEIEDGDIIQRHKLSRKALTEMKGVEGYNNDAIDQVLEEFSRGGLNEWLYVDTQKAEVEGRSVAAVNQNISGLIDALQLWGTVQGQHLIDWGMDEKSIPDPLKEYQCEVWTIGRWVIKAMLNPDPMGRKPYYKASYEEVPGTFWGNSVADLCRDTQSQCNVVARAMANNTGIASGPQVQINVDRLPPGEDITQLFPWKIWQTTSDPYGSSAQPVSFFNPASIAGELLTIYQFWSTQADEHTGVPRYMTGDSAASGAGRTASGMSMMMGNAGKSIKQVVSNIDSGILQPLIERLYYYNMKYSDDLELKGDVNIVARGANNMVAKENAQQRKNEFLQLCLNNPDVKELVGAEAIADILRDTVRTLDMAPDTIPPSEVIRAKEYQKQMQATQTAAMQANIANAPSEEIDVERGPNGEMLGMTIKQIQPHAPQLPMMGIMPGPGYATPGGSNAPPKTMTNSGQTLANGAPVTDNFSPMRVH